MNFKYNLIDSKIFGKSIYDLIDFKISDNYTVNENNLTMQNEVLYILAKINSAHIQEINKLIKYGYEYIEFQIKYMHEALYYKDEINTKGYDYSEITESELELVQNIVKDTFTIDRVSMDSELKERFKDINIASKRYMEYIKKSFIAENQKVYKFYKKENSSIIGFFSILYDRDSTLLLVGLDNKYKGQGLGNLLIKSYISACFEQNSRTVISNVSGINILMMNTIFSKCGAKIIQTDVVLRKLF